MTIIKAYKLDSCFEHFYGVSDITFKNKEKI